MQPGTPIGVWSARLTAGLRTGVAHPAARPRGERATLSVQIPRAAGPVLGGWLIHAGRFAAPFFIATALQALYLVLYRRFFGAPDAADA